MRTLVWFKRDFRLHDHPPLHDAWQAGDEVLPLYLCDRDWWCGADASRRQLLFALECVHDLDQALRARGSRLLMLAGDPLSQLARLHAVWPFERLHSHEETGNAISFARDRAIAAWCREHGVRWRQSRQFAVRRGGLDRDHWDGFWKQEMQQEMQQALRPAPDALRYPTGAPDGLSHAALLAEVARWPVAGEDCPRRQRGGRAQATRVLHQFLHVRGINYRASLSSPLRAGQGNSRLSPYLSWGCLSLREVLQALARRRADSRDDPAWSQALTAFKSRLHWHCHFIQKFEQEPALEFHNMNRAFDGLRNEGELTPAETRHLQAWCAGRTGYPLIDACMAMLQATGWINFRMRALLISFATHHLWLHWRLPGLHLARLFVDYEPGIHYPQLQMQAGVTGINALRVYNPVKQQRDQDPDGHFVRRWLPALRHVPDSWLAEPWRMPPALQVTVGCRIGQDYPAPVVDHERSAREAKARLHAWRRQPAAREAARSVLARHGSRRRPQDRGSVRPRPPDSGQLPLDLG